MGRGSAALSDPSAQDCRSRCGVRLKDHKAGYESQRRPEIRSAPGGPTGVRKGPRLEPWSRQGTRLTRIWVRWVLTRIWVRWVESRCYVAGSSRRIAPYRNVSHRCRPMVVRVGFHCRRLRANHGWLRNGRRNIKASRRTQPTAARHRLKAAHDRLAVKTEHDLARDQLAVKAKRGGLAIEAPPNRLAVRAACDRLAIEAAPNRLAVKAAPDRLAVSGSQVGADRRQIRARDSRPSPEGRVAAEIRADRQVTQEVRGPRRSQGGRHPVRGRRAAGRDVVGERRRTGQHRCTVGHGRVVCFGSGQAPGSLPPNR